MSRPHSALAHPTTLIVASASPSEASRRRIVAIAQVAGCGVLTAVAAQVQVRVPGLIVPFTLQSLVVLVAGMLLTPRRALAAMAVYLAAGSALVGLGTGWSAFAPGSLGLMGATGGYLIGFLVAAPVMSWMATLGQRTTAALVLAGLTGTAVIFVLGVAWLAMFTGSLKAAVAGGAAPFASESLLKLVAAVAMAKAYGILRRPKVDA